MKPNILLILNDHQAYYRHGWDGGIKPATPHFDRLAHDGVRFTRAYTPTALCVPARRSLLTGMMPAHHGLTTNDERQPETCKDMFFKPLAQAGYQCCYFGKWHNGPARLWQEGCRGFAPEGYGNPYATEEYAAYCRNRGIRGRAHIRHSFRAAKYPAGEHELAAIGTVPVAYGEFLGDEDAHEAFFLANSAGEELARLSNSAPWFMMVSFWGPHRPYLPSRRFLDPIDLRAILPYGNFSADLAGKPAGYRMEHNEGVHDGTGRLLQPSPRSWADWQEDLARCYAHIAMVDDAGGRILKRLDELSLARETLVFWTTDHGDAIASHGGHVSKGPYMSEELYRVPLAVRWPGVAPAGRHSQALVSLIDIAPTLLAAAGTDFGRPCDGRSFDGVLQGTTEMARTAVTGEFHGLHCAGDHPGARCLVTPRYRYVATPGDVEELYDLERDPYQLCNLAAAKEHHDLCCTLQRTLAHESLT